MVRRATRSLSPGRYPGKSDTNSTRTEGPTALRTTAVQRKRRFLLYHTINTRSSCRYAYFCSIIFITFYLLRCGRGPLRQRILLAFLNEKFAQWATGGHSQQQSIVTSIRFFPPPPPPSACSVGCCRRLHGRGMSKRRDPGSKLVSWFLALLWYSLFSLWAWPLSS